MAEGEELDDVILSQESVNAHFGNPEAAVPEGEVEHGALPKAPHDMVVDADVGRRGVLDGSQNVGPCLRRRRPNQPPVCARAAALPVGSLLHYSKKPKLRRLCRKYRKQTKWICPGCRRLSMCLGECFQTFHMGLGM
jgi:hypothetical protein